MKGKGEDLETPAAKNGEAGNMDRNAKNAEKHKFAIVWGAKVAEFLGGASMAQAEAQGAGWIVPGCRPRQGATRDEPLAQVPSCVADCR